MNKALKYSILVTGILCLALIPGKFLFQEEFPVCMFRHLTGIECPLCGMTRACFEIIHMNLSSAFRLNPLSFLLPVVLITEAGYDFFPDIISGKVRGGVLTIALSASVVLFLARIILYFEA